MALSLLLVRTKMPSLECNDLSATTVLFVFEIVVVTAWSTSVEIEVVVKGYDKRSPSEAIDQLVGTFLDGPKRTLCGGHGPY